MRILLVLSLLLAAVPAAAQQLADDEVKQQIIAEPIASYPGRCPCPYNLAKNGGRCGGRSAWSKAGGYSPICYPEDVTPAMVAAWRTEHDS